jgi:hypothetical protein
MHAEGAFAPHRRQQLITHTGQPFVAESPQFCLDHPIRTLCQIDRCRDSEKQELGKSF